MDKETTLSVVTALNEALFNSLGEKFYNENGWSFSLVSDGYYECIKFNGDIVWCSEDDPREWDEEHGGYKESLYSHIVSVLHDRAIKILEFTQDITKQKTGGNKMEELIKKVEVHENSVKDALRWLSENRINGLNEISLNAVIRYLLKRISDLEEKIEKVKN